MKPALLLFTCFLTILTAGKAFAAKTYDQFYNQILGKWYVTQWEGGISGDIYNYDPLPADSVIISRISGTDSIQITGYNNSNPISNDKFSVVWSTTYNDVQLSSNGAEIFTELLPGFLKIYRTENITTFNRIESYLFSGDINNAAALMRGRWYVTAIGSASFETTVYPASGDSIIVSAKDASDSIMLSYFQNCEPEHSDKYLLTIDSSFSLQTDALLLLNNSEINRIMVMVSDSAMILKTDSMPGHYLVLAHIDTFTFYKAPFVSSITNDTACIPGDLALQAQSDPGNIRWYTQAEGGDPIAHGNVFFPAGISGTTTFYVDATLNGCVTDTRTPVIAVISCPSAISDGDRKKTVAFPVPTSGKFEIQLAEELNPTLVIIYNEAGTALEKIYPVTDSRFLGMDISHLPDGLYFISLHGNSDIHVVKVLKKSNQK